MNLTPVAGGASREVRERLLSQRGCVVWFTGLSGSGKSTIASSLEKSLVESGHLAYLLDGDNLRSGINRDLGFSVAERDENVRRVGEIAALFADAGVIALASLISPHREGRERARSRVEAGRFIEVFVATPLEVCESRDVKGLYARARRGEIAEFTGISSPYEPPLAPELTIGPDSTPDEAAAMIVVQLRERRLLEATP